MEEERLALAVTAGRSHRFVGAGPEAIPGVP